jgi:hypothetical protein
MTQIFTSIMQRVASAMPALSLIDEDYGQLETNTDTYPVTFPCCLIGNADTDWQDLTGSVQRGDATITVRLAIDCYDDTHFSSDTFDRVVQRQQLAHTLFCTLQGFRPAPNANPLTRIKSHMVSLPQGIKVYELIFRFRLSESCTDDL